MLKITKLTATEDVYDITVEDNHNFFADGICVHNCVETALRPFQFCLTGDTNILTPSGYRSIDSIIADGKDFEVVSAFSTDKEFKKQTPSVQPAQVFATGVKETFNIRLDRGPSLTATGNHKFLTQDGYVAVEDLDPDYHMLYSPSFDITPINCEGDYTANEYDLLGWVIGDGWFTNNPNNKPNVYESMGVVFGSAEDAYAEQKLMPVFVNMMQDAVNSGVTRNQTTNTCKQVSEGGVVTYRTQSTRARYIGARLGIHPGTAKDKLLPELFWGLSSDDKIRVLSALFSADGSVQNEPGMTKSVRLAMSNITMAQQVQQALSEFGIVSKYTVSERKHSSRCNIDVVLTVTNQENIERFASVVGFRLHPRKQQAVNNLLSSYQAPNRRSRAEYNWFTIKDIVGAGMQEVFDISVPETHNFIANGIITHNCNLNEVNVSDIVDQQDLNDRVAAAAFIGTLQAGYTDFHYLRPVWKDTTEKDALLGVSMTGIASGAVDQLDLQQAAEVTKSTNEEIAKLIGINPAARITCVKPAGSSSLVVGSSSGIHPWHAQYYIRRMRVGKNEALYGYVKDNFPELVEDCRFKPHIDAVLSIPQQAPEGATLRSESAIEFLKRVQKYNTQWVYHGHRDGRNTHNVSCTVSVGDTEWEEVGKWMWDNQNDYTGISVLPRDNHTYVQAPFEDCTKETFESMLPLLHGIDLTQVIEVEDGTNLSDQAACAGGVCSLI